VVLRLAEDYYQPDITTASRTPGGCFLCLNFPHPDGKLPDS
jgi:hypothetical protein